jgi:hypothetical protein
VDGLGQKLLAASRLAENQHGAIGVGDLLGLRQELRYRLTVSDDRLVSAM